MLKSIPLHLAKDQVAFIYCNFTASKLYIIKIEYKYKSAPLEKNKKDPNGLSRPHSTA